MANSNIVRRGINPAVETSGEYAQLFSAMSMFKKFVDTCADVVVTAVSSDGKYVTCKQIAGERMENGNDLPQLEYANIPIAQIKCSCGYANFRISVGDIGIIFARKFDISMPEQQSTPPERTQVKSGRIMSFSQGFFMPLSFSGSAQFDFHLQSGDSYVKIDSGNIEVSVSGNANIKATNVVLEANQVSLGGSDGIAIARHGDSVVSGGSVVGTIVATSTVSKSL